MTFSGFAQGDWCGFERYRADNERIVASGELPEVVFWNVQSRNNQQPVTKNEQGVALISGCTPMIFSLLRRDLIDPYAVMMDVLCSERYRDIAA